jgi:NAD+ synthetase
MKIRGSVQKYVLKELMKSKLKVPIAQRKKVGFDIPTHDWFRGPLRQRVKDALLGERLADTGYFDQRYLRHLVEQHQSGVRDYSSSLWTLLMFDAFLRSLAGEFEGLAPDAAEENIQARVRGTLLMALSNKFGSIVLTTGNKSEMAVGYATLYGDMAGGFAVLKDISKTLVYRLCRYRNTLGRVIPERIITRPPSAELRPNQVDQDSLPPYDILDAILECYVEHDRAPAEIDSLGFRAEDVRKVVRLIKTSEYKRRQAAVGIRITPRGFGKDWRYPITSAWNEWESVGGAAQARS